MTGKIVRDAVGGIGGGGGGVGPQNQQISKDSILVGNGASLQHKVFFLLWQILFKYFLFFSRFFTIAKDASLVHSFFHPKLLYTYKYIYISGF